MTRSGFVGLAGRPNVGKSTLVNSIVGSHVAIVSVRPQTTRRAIRGVATDLEAGHQLVLVDLPGVQRPRDALTERMQRRVERELADSDLALIVINGEEGVGPGDRFIVRALLEAGARLPVICAVNKADRLGPNELWIDLNSAADRRSRLAACHLAGPGTRGRPGGRGGRDRPGAGSGHGRRGSRGRWGSQGSRGGLEGPAWRGDRAGEVVVNPGADAADNPARPW